MKTLRRYSLKNCYYFITIVTQNRKPILLKDIEIFYKSIDDLDITAWVILPDHLHFIISIKDESISKLIHRLKITYSRLYRNKFGSGKVLQNRFWDHVIRSQDDFNNHINYIHYNPVKHKISSKPLDWKHSSIISYYNKGFYSDDWGVHKELKFDGKYGE